MDLSPSASHLYGLRISISLWRRHLACHFTFCFSSLFSYRGSTVAALKMKRIFGRDKPKMAKVTPASTREIAPGTAVLEVCRTSNQLDVYSVYLYSCRSTCITSLPRTINSGKQCKTSSCNSEDQREHQLMNIGRLWHHTTTITTAAICTNDMTLATEGSVNSPVHAPQRSPLILALRR